MVSAPVFDGTGRDRATMGVAVATLVARPSHRVRNGVVLNEAHTMVMARHAVGAVLLKEWPQGCDEAARGPVPTDAVHGVVMAHPDVVRARRIQLSHQPRKLRRGGVWRPCRSRARRPMELLAAGDNADDRVDEDHLQRAARPRDGIRGAVPQPREGPSGGEVRERKLGAHVAMVVVITARHQKGY
jgi:hypothetical protein